MVCLGIYYIEGPVFKCTLNPNLCLGIYSSHNVSVIQILRLTRASLFLLIVKKKKKAAIFNYPSEYLYYAFMIVFWHQWTILQYYASVLLLKLFINALVDNLL